jgi:hypothetical protein
VSVVVLREIVLGQAYLVMSTDGREQAQIERGHPVSLDQGECVVLEVNGNHLLVPKARIDLLIDVESGGTPEGR